MKCQSCDNQATVHLTDIVAGKKKTVHLCQECAEKNELVKNQEMNLNVILQSVIGQHIGPMTDELSRLTCPTCGIKYMEFKAEGRLGCPRDYEIFQNPLKPLLFRIHRSQKHVGKVPKNSTRHAAALNEMMDLRAKLRQAIDSEAYEQAAQLRDLIRQKETPG